LNPGPTGTSLPDPRRSDDQQPAPWLASATHSAPAYPLLNNPGILNPSPSPGIRITFNDVDPAPFREVLKKSGFYAEWKKKFGDESWQMLEEATGQQLT